MIKSMTAFARESAAGTLGEFTWELRAVNHRFLEPHIRLPDDLRGLESAVRERLAARLARGKVDCNLRYVARPEAGAGLRVNRRLVTSSWPPPKRSRPWWARSVEPSAFDLLRWPGVLEEPAAGPRRRRPGGHQPCWSGPWTPWWRPASARARASPR